MKVGSIMFQQSDFKHGSSVVIGKNVGPERVQFYDKSESVPIEGLANPADEQDQEWSETQDDPTPSGYLRPWRIFLEPGDSCFPLWRRNVGEPANHGNRDVR